jgi:hypothetical protein
MPKIIESAMPDIAEHLTPEEIAAFEAEDENAVEEALGVLAKDDEEDEDKTDETDEAIEDTDDDEDEDVADSDEEDSGDDIEPDADEVDDEPADQDTNDVAASDVDDRPKPPEVSSKELEAQLQPLEAELDSLSEQLENLEIDRKDYNEKVRELTRKMAPLAAKIELAKEQEAAYIGAWNNEVIQYLNEYPGLNDGGPALEAFDRAVRAVTSRQKFGDLSWREQLERAHSLLIGQADVLDFDVPKMKRSRKADPAKPAKKTKKGTVGGTVPTLANTPASEISGGADSPEAQLEILAQRGNDPIAFEEALAKLPKEKRDQFSSANIGV